MSIDVAELFQTEEDIVEALTAGGTPYLINGALRNRRLWIAHLSLIWDETMSLDLRQMEAWEDDGGQPAPIVFYRFVPPNGFVAAPLKPYPEAVRQ